MANHSHASAPAAPAPPGPLAARLAQFAADGGAATAVEFAVLVPIFMWIVLQICQIGLYFFYSASLFRVTEAATRQILLGSVANASLTATQFRDTILCPLLPGEMSCADIITNIQVVPSYAAGGFYALTNYQSSSSSPLGYTLTGLTTPPLDNAKTSFCIGSGGSVVAVQVYYAMPILGLPWLLPGATMWNGTPSIFISATSAFKNEPFTTTYQGC